MTDRDRGLQAERTALAWSRTAAVVLVNGVLLGRAGLHTGDPVLTSAGVLVLALAVLVWWYGRHRFHRSGGHCEIPAAPPYRSVRVLAGLVAAGGAVALAGLVTGLPPA